MVRFHVLNDDKIQIFAVQRVRQIFKEGFTDRLVYGIKKNVDIVEQQISVVGNAARDGVNPLEHCKTPVIGADPDEIICNFFCTIHF